MASSSSKMYDPTVAESILGIQPAEGEDKSKAATIAGLTDIGIFCFGGESG